VDIGDKTVHV
jgi:hypothetical protein